LLVAAAVTRRIRCYTTEAQNLDMKVVLPQINFLEVPRRLCVAYTAVLEVSEDSVLFLSGLLHAECVRRGTAKDGVR
jgi:hypothetical protein